MTCAGHLWAACTISQPKGPGFRCSMRAFMAQGRDGARLLASHPAIELFGHDRFEIMARAFGFGPIDNPDRAFQQWLGKPRTQLAFSSADPFGKAAGDAGGGASVLVASGSAHVR